MTLKNDWADGDTVHGTDLDAIVNVVNSAEQTGSKNQANGYAGLDGGGKLQLSQMPSSIMEYKGTWNASTNSPTLADGTGHQGDVYRVTTAGSRDLGSGSISFSVGDYAIYNGSTWEKSDTTDAVASVNSKTGVVSLVADDVPESGSPTNRYFTDSRADGRISAAVGVSVQAYDSDLGAIGALSPANDDVVQRKSGAWTNRSMSQLKTDLSLAKADVGLGNVDNTSNATERAAARTLTNARVTARIGTATSSATPSINIDSYDQFNITALATAITSMTSGLSGTPTDGQKLIVRIKDAGSAEGITWGASWRAMGVALPTTTVISKTLYVGAVYNAADSIWDVVAVGQQA